MSFKKAIYKICKLKKKSNQYENVENFIKIELKFLDISKKSLNSFRISKKSLIFVLFSIELEVCLKISKKFHNLCMLL